jgi:hypothetical protein
MLPIPEQYCAMRRELEFDSIEYGVGGVELWKVEDIAGHQLRYSVDASGKSLLGSKEGDWQRDWIAIGRETACGDPIFLSAEPPHPVFTAMHGEGCWDPRVIAPTTEKFFACLHLFQKMASGRGTPVDLETNHRRHLSWNDLLETSVAFAITTLALSNSGQSRQRSVCECASTERARSCLKTLLSERYSEMLHLALELPNDNVLD